MWREVRDLRWRLAAATTSASTLDAMIWTLSKKRLLFSSNAGRTGSKTVARLLSRLPDVDARHEPKPNFVWAMRAAQRDPAVARAFLVGAKLRDIARSPAPVYAETSHLFGKGFLEPLLALGLTPDLILLTRDARRTALSHLRIGSAPARTQIGRRYLIDPTCPNFAPVADWRDWTDYQLCYWYALETRARQQVHAARVRAAGGRAAWIDIDEIATPGRFTELLETLGLDAPRAVRSAIADELHVRHNTRPSIAAEADGDLDDQEQMVADSIAWSATA